MDEALPTPQSPESRAAERVAVEGEMGDAIDDLFARSNAQQEPGESRNVTLFGGIDHNGKVPEARITETISEDGNRTVNMIYDGGAWPGAGFRYSEVPNEKPKLTAIKERDGIIEEQPEDSISQTDFDVSYWGKIWLNNFESMHLERPKVEPIRKLGKIATWFSNRSK